MVSINNFKKQNLVVHQLPSGHHLDISIYTYGQEKSSKTVYIQSSVHGAELQGNLLIYELHQLLKEVKVLGKIIMVPLANPLASNQKTGPYTQGRFNPLTGDNWNRNYTDFLSKEMLGEFCEKIISEKKCFSSYQINLQFKAFLYKKIKLLKQKMIKENGPSLNRIPNLTYQLLASGADIVLDLHTGPHATDYLYCAEYEKKKAKDLNFPFHIIIPNKFAGAMDEASFIPWYKLHKKLKSLGIDYQTSFEAYTVELGSEELISNEKAKKQALKVASYLQKRKIISPLPDQYNQQELVPKKHFFAPLKNYKTYHSEYGALFEYLKRPGEYVKKNEPLGRFYFLQQLEHHKSSTKDLLAKHDCHIINHNTSSSIHQGAELYQVLENSFS